MRSKAKPRWFYAMIYGSWNDLYSFREFIYVGDCNPSHVTPVASLFQKKKKKKKKKEKKFLACL